jgi:hypothetical protein
MNKSPDTAAPATIGLSVASGDRRTQPQVDPTNTTAHAATNTAGANPSTTLLPDATNTAAAGNDPDEHSDHDQVDGIRIVSRSGTSISPQRKSPYDQSGKDAGLLDSSDGDSDYNDGDAPKNLGVKTKPGKMQVYLMLVPIAVATTMMEMHEMMFGVHMKVLTIMKYLIMVLLERFLAFPLVLIYKVSVMITIKMETNFFESH